MIAYVSRAAQLAVLALLASFAQIVLAQGDDVAPSSAGDAAPSIDADFDEEIVVRGRSYTLLRRQLELAQEAVFARFNEINSDDEFDIHCRREEITGSLIDRRVCQANLWRTAQARAGEETLRAMQGGISLPPEIFIGEALAKNRLLADEMRRLAVEDEELGRAVDRLANVSAMLSRRRIPVPSPDATLERDRAADDGVLPYDASRVVEVRIGREPWRHALTTRTFTIAQLYGEISAIAVECAGDKVQLAWETAAEWTLPEDWGVCTLLVDAPRGTSFALYEFE